jgi:hypothetical protein
MRRVTTWLFLTISAVCFAAGADTRPANEGNGIDQDALWQSLAGRPNPALMDDFEVIGGLTLVAAGEGLSADAAALATVLGFELAPPPLLRFPSDGCFRYANYLGMAAFMQAARERWGDSLPDEQQRALSKFVGPGSGAFAERADTVRRMCSDVPAELRTDGLEDGFYVQSCLEEAGGIEQAVGLFSSEVYLAPTVQVQAPAEFATLRNAVDRQIPVLLEADAGLLVCVGYIAGNGGEFLIVYDPGAGKTTVLTGEDLIHPVDRASKDPRVGRAAAVIGGMELHWDAKLELPGERPAGVTIREFVPGTWSATYIHTWRPALGTLIEEAAAYVQAD